MVSDWIGVDGYGDTDVIQDGIYASSLGQTISIKAFYEYYPDYAQENPNMVISPWDSMYFIAHEGDASCNEGPGYTGYACFWYEDVTTGVAFTPGPIQAPNDLFQGLTAEAIMEKQYAYDLTAWLSSQTNFGAADSSFSEHYLSTDPYDNITLIDLSLAPLCAASKDSGSSAGFTWLRAN